MIDDVNRVLEEIYGRGIGRFYCSSRVSWKLAKTIDWLRGTIIEALTRPDTRIFYLLTVYYELLNILSICHGDLAEAMRGKTPYQLLHDSEVIAIIENIMKR